jgi:hypothetical protein
LLDTWPDFLICCLDGCPDWHADLLAGIVGLLHDWLRWLADWLPGITGFLGLLGWLGLLAGWLVGWVAAWLAR